MRDVVENSFREETCLPSDCHPNIVRFYNYWRTISPCGALPGRQHFDPSDIPQLLANTWLLEKVEKPLRFKVRVIGSAVSAFFGLNATGRWLHDFADSKRGEVLHRLLGEVCASGKLNWRRGRPLIVADKDFMALERIFLPMARDGNNVDMILCYSHYYDNFEQIERLIDSRKSATD